MSNRKPTKKRTRARKKKSFLQRLRQQHEFRPDAPRISLPRLFHLTNLQRRSLLKWTLYALVCLACLLVQDVIMSRTHIFGATTDLVVCAIFLITVIEGSYEVNACMDPDFSCTRRQNGGCSVHPQLMAIQKTLTDQLRSYTLESLLK